MDTQNDYKEELKYITYGGGNSELKTMGRFIREMLVITMACFFLSFLISVIVMEAFDASIATTHLILIVGFFISFIIGLRYASHSIQTHYSITNPKIIISSATVVFTLFVLSEVRPFLDRNEVLSIQNIVTGILSISVIIFFFIISKNSIHKGIISPTVELETQKRDARIRKIGIIGMSLIILSMIFVAFQK